MEVVQVVSPWFAETVEGDHERITITSEGNYAIVHGPHKPNIGDVVNSHAQWQRDTAGNLLLDTPTELKACQADINKANPLMFAPDGTIRPESTELTILVPAGICNTGIPGMVSIEAQATVQAENNQAAQAQNYRVTGFEVEALVFGLGITGLGIWAFGKMRHHVIYEHNTSITNRFTPEPRQYNPSVVSSLDDLIAYHNHIAEGVAKTGKGQIYIDYTNGKLILKDSPLGTYILAETATPPSIETPQKPQHRFRKSWHKELAKRNVQSNPEPPIALPVATSRLLLSAPQEPEELVNNIVDQIAENAKIN